MGTVKRCLFKSSVVWKSNQSLGLLGKTPLKDISGRAQDIGIVAYLH